MMIEVGKLRHKVNIQQQSSTQDDYGELVDTWTNHKSSLSAFIEPTGGSEFYAAQKINSEANTNIWIRYTSGIKPSMRVSYGSRIFDILAVMNIQEANRLIRLICKEVI